jgi:hypothetical protein
MSIGTANSKAVDGNSLEFILRPFDTIRRNLQILLLEWDFWIWVVELDVWWYNTVFQSQNCLDHGSDS